MKDILTMPVVPTSSHSAVAHILRAMKDDHTAPVVSDDIRPPLRTLVVDDSATFAEILCCFLETQPLIQVVGTAAQGGEAVHLAAVLQPDLVLMDLNMPLVDGLQATAILRSRLPHIRVIIMTVDESAKADAAARAHGAYGFVGKTRIISDLMTEICQVFVINPTHRERNTLCR